MKFDHSNRLRGYDYARPGGYFVTICTERRIPWFRNRLLREAAERCWRAIPEHHPFVELDAWVVMPNHFHGILLFNGYPTDDDTPETTLAPRAVRNEAREHSAISPRRGTLGVVIRTFKGAVTMEARRAGVVDFIWQQRYYDHIVRHHADLERIRRYIMNNPRVADVARHGFVAHSGPCE